VPVELRSSACLLDTSVILLQFSFSRDRSSGGIIDATITAVLAWVCAGVWQDAVSHVVVVDNFMRLW
jgi:hypothetical protein